MKYASALSEQEIYLHAAALAAHLTNAAGFRQRDFRFYGELCVNWAEDYQQRQSFRLQNNQVKRYLEFLVREGFAVVKTKESSPRYVLSRIGLLELLEKMRSRSHALKRQHFMFVHYFLRTYKKTFEQLLALPGKPFPPALKIELQRLVDLPSLISEEMQLVEREIEIMRTRIRDAQGTSALVTRLLQKKTITEQEIITAVEDAFPYELNSQKPLSELVNSLPEETRLWELQQGTRSRAQYLWEPSLRLLYAYREELHKLNGND